MNAEGDLFREIVIIGGGPAGATLACFLRMAGHEVMVIESDIHPRDHVGEALTPSTNVPLQKIGFLDKMEEAAFVRKPGVVWTTPNSPPGKLIAVTTSEFPFPGAPRPYSYNVERDVMDAMLLRHAHEMGAEVIQGVRVQKVLFEEGRAVGARIKVADGWERDVRADFVVDASGRSCFLAKQLGLRRKDVELNQFSIWTWFREVEPGPAPYQDYLFLHFLGLEKAWAWQIPLRNGVTSVGVVTEKGDFHKSGRSDEEFFADLVSMNRTFTRYMERAEQMRPLQIEGDYTYDVETLTGPGWLLVGDALRFVDPVFSSGMDVAVYSAQFAAEAIDSIARGGSEEAAFAEYSRKMQEGVDVWYDLCVLFYRLQTLFTIFAVKKRFREHLIRVLQGNPYEPETLERAKGMVATMREAEERVAKDPDNLLGPAGRDVFRKASALAADAT